MNDACYLLYVFLPMMQGILSMNLHVLPLFQALVVQQLDLHLQYPITKRLVPSQLQMRSIWCGMMKQCQWYASTLYLFFYITCASGALWQYELKMSIIVC